MAVAALKIGFSSGGRAKQVETLSMLSVNHNLVLAPAESKEADRAEPVRIDRRVVWMTAALSVVLIGSHWPTLSQMVHRWTYEPQYSHGFLVPMFALVVLWSRRDMLKRSQWQPGWIGLPLLLIGVCLRLLAIQTDIEPLDAFALLPTVFGVVLLVGGVSVLRWAWPALAFLAFMMPLPYAVEISLALPLRRVATLMSTYALQTLGCPAVAEGNIVFIEDIRLGVEEACSGLGMLMTFFALATALAMMVRVALWERIVLVASAVPIAILANVLRITATGFAYYHAGKESSLAHMIYHDLAGWLMMPLALGMLWVVLMFLSNLFIQEQERSPLSLGKPRLREARAEPAHGK